MNSLKLINDELESNENKKINQRMDRLEGRMDRLEEKLDEIINIIKGSGLTDAKK